jgi:malto-oligosyltrehalose trehalohydrolase
MTDMRFGAELRPDGVTFRLWAPAAKGVDVMLGRAHPMQALASGWYEAMIPGLGAGTLYKYRIDGELEVPDPASHFQPSDVSGPSEVIDHDRFAWRTAGWRGRPWADAVITELHVGTFTREGTFASAIERLDALVDAGMTAIELMPIADFAGRRNWGYDGVLLYAPDSTYGRPDDLRTLVDQAHARGLMVFLDVVYNHFGPEGNYLHRYAPQFFAPAHTPWGAAIDYRVPQVRAFAIGNALHWLTRYRFDGLRLDAVHAIGAPGEPSILDDLGRAVGELAAASGRAIHLVLENDDNRASLLDPLADPPLGKYRAQWNDDYHHAWHVLLTGEENGYYQDYAGNPAGQIARVLCSGFAYQGEASPHRGGHRRGEPSQFLSPLAFVNFLQNHDQIGNRPLGERLVTQIGEAPLAAALAVTLLAPMPALLFMGEEWGATEPFPFFCDFPEPLASAVRKGRREEFRSAYAALASEASGQRGNSKVRAHSASKDARDRADGTRPEPGSSAHAVLGDGIPDPLAEGTFRTAVLDWDARSSPAGRKRLGLVRDLLTIRQREVTPHLATSRFGAAQDDNRVLRANWPLGDGRSLILLANLSDAAAKRPLRFRTGRPIWGEEPASTLSAWAVFWSIGAD